MNDTSENTTPAEAPSEPKAPAKPAISICITRNGNVIVRNETPGATPRKTLNIPLNINADTRLFVRNGEIVRPFVSFEFRHRRTLDISGFDVSLYNEAGMKEFDPSDMQPIAIRSLDKDFDEQNAKTE